MQEQLEKQFKGKKALVVGLGLQGGGVGMVEFFVRLGATVRATDLKSEDALQESVQRLKKYSAELTLGGHKQEDFLWADVIFKGPSVPWDMPHIVEAQKKGIPVEMEASFFATYCPAPIIGVTGTRGKSTTASMIYETLKNAGKKTYLAGNVAGVSTISLLEYITKDDWVVLELSSWQLSGFHRRTISPHIAVFTNFYPDHLNYYKNLDEYLYDKTAIFCFQKESDTLIAHESVRKYIKTAAKVTSYTKNTYTNKLKYLSGDHNYENASGALLAAVSAGIDRKNAIVTISDFHGLPFRLQKIASIDGVDVYNDTTSTTPIACEKAIDTLKKKRIILLLGGNSKKLSPDNLVKKINTDVYKIVLLKGTFTDEITPFLDKSKIKDDTIYANLGQAVHTAFEGIKQGDVILFSPAATSFAHFKNEFHRGEEFNKAVQTYATKKKDA